MKAVRHEIWSLKSRLRENHVEPDSLLEISANAVRLNPASDLWCDVHEFEAVLNELELKDDEDKVSALEKAITDYGGDLMPGHELPLFVWRRRALRNRYLNALETLARTHETACRWDNAIGVLHRLLNADPLIESAHRSLMRCYAAKGDRVRALRQYRHCRTALADAFEDSVMPTDDTQNLYALILRGRALASGAVKPLRIRPPGQPASGPMPDINNYLLADLGAVRNDIQAISGRLDQLVSDLAKG